MAALPGIGPGRVPETHRERLMGERTDRYLQLRVQFDVVPGSDRTTVRCSAVVHDRGNRAERRLLYVAVDHRLDGLNIADTVRAAGEMLVAEAFRMGSAAPGPPRTSAPSPGRVVPRL